MSKYRFKTKEEFKRDGLWTKDCPDTWTSSGSMNKYLGTDIPDEYNGFCDVNEDFYYEGWSFLAKDYVLKETAFALPSKWCIKVTEENVETLGKWRSSGPLKDERYVDGSWYLHTPKHGAKGFNENRKDPEYTEITFEQFKQHVLKESPVVETTKEIDMKDIQEEVKKRFPIGCKFIPVDGDNTYTLIEDSCTYEIYEKSIFAHYMSGELYNKGKWATLVSSPETTKEMFYEGDYIVTLDVENGWNCAKKNYCFKQRMNFTGMAPAVDLNGSTSNSHSVMSFDKKQCLKDWRYATPEEAAEYERIGRPYDVTTLQKKEESIPEYVECVSYFGERFVGKIYNTKIDTPEKNTSCSWEQILIENNRLEDGSFKISTKEAYEAQNAPKQLTKEDLVEGEIYVYDDSHISTYPVGPSIAIKDKLYNPNERWMWTLSIAHATEEQKALLRREIEKRDKKTVIEEWSEGTYAVGVKGNFGVYTKSDNLVPVGRIFTIEENRKDTLVVKDHSFWIYKKNLRWFATYLDALDFSNQLKASPSPTRSDTSELTPLEICKQKYRKGMRVMSADNSGMFSGEFTIEVDPDKFTVTGAGVDYHYSRGWLYLEGKYAEILDTTAYVGAYDPHQIEEVKKETFIENVQSVDVDLVSKKKIKIF